MGGTTAAVFEVPTAPYPRTITTTLGALEYRLTFRWMNATDGGWVVDIADGGGAPIVGSVPLVTGADLLAQYGYLGVGVRMAVQSDGDPMAAPGFGSLGVSSHLYFAVAP